jgi:hypothetical protein
MTRVCGARSNSSSGRRFWITCVESVASCLLESQYAIRNQCHCGDGRSKGSDRNSTAESPDPGVKHSLRVGDYSSAAREI